MPLVMLRYAIPPLCAGATDVAVGVILQVVREVGPLIYGAEDGR